ncbi:hypothetical protein AB3S75_045093 [Citrus x aurantiifolia]
MHRIPSELRNSACLGECSTKMGDLLGSRRVAPLILSFQSVNPRFAAGAFTFCARQILSIASAGSPGHLGPAGGRGKGRGGTNCAAAEPGQDGGHVLSRFAVHMVMGSTLPVLMHRIPSELRSYVCLGESSTKMGDLLGSHRVAPLLLSFQPVNPLFAADPFTFCARQMVSIAGAGSDGGHRLSRFAVHMVMGVTIPALMHRIPSQLCS